jgi:hypothetical protein
MGIQNHNQRKEYLILGVILLITLITGLVYLFVVPPWQHFDEPTNFEYAWLFANRPSRPQPGDYDAAMRRQVAASMIENKFWGSDEPERDLDEEVDPVSIGISQLDDRPLAYWVASLPLRLVRTRSVTNQLYVGRFVSVLFYLLTVLSAWGILREITSPGNALRWVFPLSLAILPGLGNLMSSMNNDAAAIAIFSLFLWGSVRLYQGGFSWLDFAWIIVTGGLCYLTKITVYIALPLIPLVLYLTLLKGKDRKLVYGILISGVLVLVFFALDSGDAAYWYRSTVQTDPTRMESQEAVVGDHVIALDANAQTFPSWQYPVFQPVLRENVAKLQGQTVTIGAWIWATQPVKSSTPVFGDGIRTYGQKIDVNTEPTFYTLKANVNENSYRAYIMLPAKLSPNEPNAKIFYDGIILAVGEWPGDEVPILSDADASGGTWGGEPFTNLLRNPSAENQTIRAQAWLDRLVGGLTSYYSGPSFNLQYLLDFSGVFWHYRITGLRMFRTFWGEFGWGDVPLLLGSRPYFTMAIYSILALVGAGLAAFRYRKFLPWEVIFLFGLSILGIWGLAFLRGTSHLSVTWFYMPVARYAYPAIIPTMMGLGLGTIGLLQFVKDLFRLPPLTPHILYLVWIFVLNIVSIYSIITYYQF